ncbi:hypothetical protein DL96DRAFT_1184222 [Flagelloscypha sp. PMI_526]|nr:hypothetical protein DL96DRAFT_1184222 [Flagelloscypha sp. PMI_526]
MDHHPMQGKKGPGRPRKSCTTCRERRKPCDGLLPCSLCNKAGHPEDCEYVETGAQSTEQQLRIAIADAERKLTQLQLQKTPKALLSGQPIFLHDPYAAFNAAVTKILEAPKSKYPQPLEWPVSVWADVYGIFLDPMELRNRHFQNKPASEQTSPCLGIALQRLDTGQEAIDQILDLFSKINCVCELDWKHRTKELQTQIAATRFFMYMDKPASTTVSFFLRLNTKLKYFSFFFSVAEFMCSRSIALLRTAKMMKLHENVVVQQGILTQPQAIQAFWTLLETEAILAVMQDTSSTLLNDRAFVAETNIPWPSAQARSPNPVPERSLFQLINKDADLFLDIAHIHNDISPVVFEGDSPECLRIKGHLVLYRAHRLDMCWRLLPEETLSTQSPMMHGIVSKIAVTLKHLPPLQQGEHYVTSLIFHSVFRACFILAHWHQRNPSLDCIRRAHCIEAALDIFRFARMFPSPEDGVPLVLSVPLVWEVAAMCLNESNGEEQAFMDLGIVRDGMDAMEAHAPITHLATSKIGKVKALIQGILSSSSPGSV